MCVRPACYIPRQPDPACRAQAARLIRRRNAGTLWELLALGLFLAALFIWSALGAGA